MIWQHKLEAIINFSGLSRRNKKRQLLLSTRECLKVGQGLAWHVRILGMANVFYPLLMDQEHAQWNWDSVPAQTLKQSACETLGYEIYVIQGPVI